jgi:CRISPR-associated protein Csd2
MKNYLDPNKRHDFILLFDVQDGNPNGDPDSGNLPRTDPMTGEGLVTDVCLKRKIRNYIQISKSEVDGFGIYINDKGVYLNDIHKKAFEEVGLKGKGKKQPLDERRRGATQVCATYYDVRMFGAVMSTGDQKTGANCGQVRGPLQMTFARSINPVQPYDISITRMVKTDATEKDSADSGSTSGTMGRKAILSYGLYIGHGFYSPALGKQTGVSTEDLQLLWEALQGMFDVDRSAARGMMACRGLYVFTHADERGLGNAPAHKLFDSLMVRKRDGVEAPRRFEDYLVEGPRVPDAYTDGVTLTRLVEG